MEDYRGRVVYLYGFQSWCPGCHSRGFPTLQELIRRFDGEKDVAFIAVQTTFEGFHTNTASNALATAERYDLEIPIGHSGSEGKRSRLMSDYRTGGTPWTVIIDRKGVVRFNDFHVAPDHAERLINQLRDESVESHRDMNPEDVEIETLPEHRGGQDLIGTQLPEFEFDQWIGHWPNADASGSATEKAAGKDNDDVPKATLYRWWTNTCPSCEASLPAIEQLRQKYEGDGLRVVAVYHPKPPRAVDDQTVAAAASERGYHGAVALDQDWSVLRQFYLKTVHRRKATSASFLVDVDGAIRFVHPGPVFFPSDEARFVQQNEDYQLLERAIRSLLRGEEREQP